MFDFLGIYLYLVCLLIMLIFFTFCNTVDVERVAVGNVWQLPQHRETNCPDVYVKNKQTKIGVGGDISSQPQRTVLHVDGRGWVCVWDIFLLDGGGGVGIIVPGPLLISLSGKTFSLGTNFVF